MMSVATLVALPAAAQSQQQIDWCVNQDHAFSADQQISGCTASIQSGKWSGQGLAWAFNNRGFAYLLLKGDPDRAVADFDQAIRLDPKDAVAFANRGIIYQSKGDFDRAIVEYSEAIRLDPNNTFAFQNRGNAYQDKGDIDRAVAEYSEAIRLDPTFAVGFKSRGEAYQAKGALDRAVTDYDQAIQLNPKYTDAFNNRGFAYLLKGDLDRAVADFDQAIRLDPKHAKAFANRGIVHKSNGDLDRAIADFTESIRLDPEDPGPYYNRGLANLYAGSLPNAAADLNRSSELNPKNAYTALWLDIVDARSNLPSRFAQAVTQLDMTRWPAPVIRLYLGQMTPEAVLAAADDPDADTRQRRVCEANFFIGQMALRRSAKDEAVRLFQLVASDCRKNANAWTQANAELKALGVPP